MSKEVTQVVLKKLKAMAKSASENAHSPYSKIKVGATVLTESGKMYSGCNVENISFGGTICAERVAICKAVSEGERKFKALYLYTKEQWAPCGLCLQVMQEFLAGSSIIILGSENGVDEVITLSQLMPKKIDLITFKKLQKQ